MIQFFISYVFFSTPRGRKKDIRDKNLDRFMLGWRRRNSLPVRGAGYEPELIHDYIQSQRDTHYIKSFESSFVLHRAIEEYLKWKCPQGRLVYLDVERFSCELR